jgi:Ca2+-binding RTX toxin-like protein
LSYNDGVGTSNNLTFNVLAGTVTDGTNTDSFSAIEIYHGSNGNDLFIGSTGADTFYGNNGNDTFRGGAANDSFFGGAGTDTADYSTAASGVTASLTTNTASNDGDGGVDTFNLLENITGSAFGDTLTGDSNNNTLSGGAGNDTFIGDLGNDTLNGGGDTDTINYTASANAITFDITNNTASGTSIGTDTYLGIENVNTGAGDDRISSDAGNFFANTINFNLGSGTNDRVVLSGGAVGTDATTFASKIQNVEYLDFRNANTGGGNLVIDGNDVFAMTDASHSLRLDISNSFGLTVQAGSYAVNSSTVGAKTTYTFTSGGNFAAKLEVSVV